MPAKLTRAWRAARRSRDAGITLMEVLIASTISMILGTLTISLLLNVNTSTAQSTDRTISTADARNAIQAWTAYLRTADGTTAGSRSNRIEWLTGSDMLFYTDFNNRTMTSLGTTSAPTMIWLRLDSAKRLVEEQFSSTAAVGAAPTVCRILVHSGVINSVETVNGVSTTDPLFTAYDYSENSMILLDLGAAPTASSGCQPLPVTVPSKQSKPDTSAVANLQNVYSVKIRFTVNDTRGLNPIAFESQAFLPNLGGV